MLRKVSSLILACILFFLSDGLSGQTTTGTILGTIMDESGAVLPGATITVTHLETSETRTVVTGDEGRYATRRLALGNYEVRAGLAGFSTIIRRGIKLTVGREAVVNITLTVGEIAEEVTVSGDALLVETRSSSLSGLVDDQAIQDLPLNGRSFDNLVALHGGSALFFTWEAPSG